MRRNKVLDICRVPRSLSWFLATHDDHQAQKSILNTFLYKNSRENRDFYDELEVE